MGLALATFATLYLSNDGKHPQQLLKQLLKTFQVLIRAELEFLTD